MTETHFPPGFIEQLTSLLGPSLPDFLHGFSLPPLRGVRARSGAAFPRDAEEPVPWAENARYLPPDSAAGAHPLHEAGAWYLQEPSAMAAAAALRPEPGDRVLDLCAAPGGKSTQLAAYMRGRGVLICNEPVPGRAQALSRNIERMGVPNAAVVSALPEELSGRWAGYFDKILVDAPCSGEGMFRRHPETMEQWSPAAPQGCAQRQKHILAHAARMLRPGGRLLYSTCTFNSTENEGVVEAFLSEHPDFSLAPFALPGLPPCDGTLRLWPHRVRGEGHFAALLQKDGDAPPPRPSASDFPRPDPAMTTVAASFLREQFADAPVPNALFAGRLAAAPEGLPPLKGVRTLRLGLHMGEARGRLFLPDHAPALALPGTAVVPVDEAAARAYQAGHPLPAPEGLRGWAIPALDNMQLGWVKISDGLMKNHYPKGLRRPGVSG